MAKFGLLNAINLNKTTMRKLFYFIPILLGAILSSCYDDEINDIKNRLDTIEGTHIASLQEQVAAIKSTLPQLEKADKELKGYIEGLQTTASNLQKAIEQTNNEIENVESELKSSISTTKSEILDQLSSLKEDMEAELAQINSAITTLQQKDTELDESIANLKDYTDTELANNKDWVNATFATLEQYKVLTDDIAIIKAQIEALNKSIADLESRINEKIETEIAAAIDLLESAIQESVTDITKAYKTAISTAKDEITEAYATAIESAIAALETSMQSWVAEQLKGYYTIAEVEAKLAVLQNEVAENDELLQEEIDALSETFAKTKEDITEAYEKAIEEAITKNNGAITDKIAEEISVVNKRIDSEVAALNAKITTLQSQIDKNSADIAKLLDRIQSVSYIPAYSDGKATVKYSNIRSQVTFDFEISPKDAVVELAKVWKEALNVKATYTETRAVSFVDLPITQFEADIDNGIISIVASGENLSDEFFAGTQSASARLAISDGNNSVTSDYIPLEALEIKPESNQIWYTNGSTTEPTTSPYYITNFGANIVSNQYDTEKGHWVITFDNDITEIGPWVFEKCWSLTSITIPDSVTSISAYAFRYCSNLTSVNIPDSVTTIGWSAFTGCSSLASITIPGSVTTIDWAAFSGCSSLVSITIFNGVKLIGRSAFERCSSLTSITIPDSVTSIGRDAFCGCSCLTSITIPDSVTSIGENAFYDCRSLTSVYCKPTTPPIGGDAMFNNNAAGRKIYVPTESVDAYKTANYWEDYASDIVGYDFE